MFIAALFTIAKTQKQPKCPTTDEWIKKVWYIYTMEYYSAVKKNEILPFAATSIVFEGMMLSDINQTKTNTIECHLYVGSKTMQQTGEYTKKKQTHRYREQTSVTSGERERREGHYRGRAVRGTNY